MHWPTLELSSRSLPGSGELPEHACTTEGKGSTGNRQRFQAHALHLHLTLPLQHHDEVGVRLVPGTALACWRGAAAPLEDAARQSCGGGMNGVEGLCQGTSFLHSQVQLSTILPTLESFPLMQVKYEIFQVWFCSTLLLLQ